MANTGNKQATIAYKVSKPGGEPLDVDGNLTRISGKKQAIALLTGHVNPNPLKYEVEYYFNKQGTVTGNPTITRDIGMCTIGYISVSPDRIILNPTLKQATFILESSSSWQLISGPTNLIKLDLIQGGAGLFNITATAVSIGDGYFIFRNEATLQTATIYIANLSEEDWILEEGSWNMLGVWDDNGVWYYYKK